MPQRFDRFWLHDAVGVCGGAHVWRASVGADPYTHTFYVRLLQMPLGTPDGRRVFEAACQQAVLCKAIRHPHILQVYAFGQVDGMGWLAVEHSDGYDVEALVQTLRLQRLRIPMPLAVHITLQALRGLDYLHQHRLVHGAMHTGSLFVGSRNHVKLAAPQNAAPMAFHSLCPRPTIGLPAWVTPWSPGADVWCTAAMLQALLAVHGGHGLPPLAFETAAVPLLADVPDSLAQVLERALASRRARHRIADAATLYRHLAACQVADATASCAALLRYWVHGEASLGTAAGAQADEAAYRAGPAPAWTHAPMRALFGAPKHTPRRVSLLRRIMRP